MCSGKDIVAIKECVDDCCETWGYLTCTAVRVHRRTFFRTTYDIHIMDIADEPSIIKVSIFLPQLRPKWAIRNKVVDALIDFEEKCVMAYGL